jgi:hypothetical protein
MMAVNVASCIIAANGTIVDANDLHGIIVIVDGTLSTRA